MRLVLLLTALTAVGLQAADYNDLQVRRWNSASMIARRQHEVEVIADRIARNWGRYQKVSATSRVPASVLAGLHNMEASGSFSCHLHEGSPLTARTRFVPKGRPKTGSPPFSWEVSAADAMAYDRMAEKDWKRLGAALTAIEGYNGFGVRFHHPEVATCYLWAGMTGNYGVGMPGRYVADSKWSSTARSSQIGVAAIWKELAKRKLITIPPP